MQQNDMRNSNGRLVLVFLLIFLGAGCFYLAYREQEPFQEMKVKGEALQKLVVQEAGQEADPMERTIDFAAHLHASIRRSWDGCMCPRSGWTAPF